MPKTALPETGIDIVRKLIARIEQMERNPQLGSSSVLGGTLRFVDEAGILRMELGNLGDGHFGIKVYDVDGAYTFWADERGIVP